MVGSRQAGIDYGESKRIDPVVWIQSRAYILIYLCKTAAYDYCIHSRHISTPPHLHQISKELGIKKLCHFQIIQRPETFELLLSLGWGQRYEQTYRHTVT